MTSSRSASAGSRRSPKHAPTPADGSPGPESWHRSPTRSRRSSIRRPSRGARSASSWRRRSRPGGSSRSAPPPAGPCGRSAATRRAPPAGPGATRISRWRCAWRTRSSHGCRAPRSEAPSAPARSRKRDRIAGARSGAEGAERSGRNRRRGPRAGRCALRASTAGRSTNSARGGAMKRVPLRRRAPLRAGRPLRRTDAAATNTAMAASDEQRAAVAGRPCIVCGSEHRVDPAHLVPKSMGGCEAGARSSPCVARATEPTTPASSTCCRTSSRLWRAELAHAVGHLGLIGALRRISGNHRDSNPGALP